MIDPLIPERPPEYLDSPYLDWESGFFGFCRWTLTAEGHDWMMEEEPMSEGS